MTQTIVKKKVEVIEIERNLEKADSSIKNDLETVLATKNQELLNTVLEGTKTLNDSTANIETALNQNNGNSFNTSQNITSSPTTNSFNTSQDLISASTTNVSGFSEVTFIDTKLNNVLYFLIKITKPINNKLANLSLEELAILNHLPGITTIFGVIIFITLSFLVTFFIKYFKLNLAKNIKISQIDNEYVLILKLDIDYWLIRTFVFLTSIMLISILLFCLIVLV